MLQRLEQHATIVGELQEQNQEMQQQQQRTLDTRVSNPTRPRDTHLVCGTERLRRRSNASACDTPSSPGDTTSSFSTTRCNRRPTGLSCSSWWSSPLLSVGLVMLHNRLQEAQLQLQHARRHSGITSSAGCQAAPLPITDLVGWHRAETMLLQLKEARHQRTPHRFGVSPIKMKSHGRNDVGKAGRGPPCWSYTLGR